LLFSIININGDDEDGREVAGNGEDPTGAYAMALIGVRRALLTRKVVSAGGADAAETTAFLARMSGLDGAHTNAYAGG
jgi:hypothetical protein